MTAASLHHRIYLDNNATTMLDSRVADAIDACHRCQYANPASSHAEGQRARHRLDDARDEIARILGAQVDSFPPDRLVLTSGGTEANNLALQGLSGDPPGRILISSVEHPSVRETAKQLGQRGFDVLSLPVDREGRVLLDEYQRRLIPETRLVSVICGNHETGVLQPIESLSAIAAERNVPFHTDAVQVIGKKKVSFRRLGVTSLSFSAHKFHGPTGVGGLLVRAKTPIRPILSGGSQQLAVRPGTESVPLAVGMCHALQLWETESSARHQRMLQLRNQLEAGLTRNLASPNQELIIHGGGAERLPQTLNVSFLGVDRQILLMALDQVGVACSSGSACTSGSSEPSPVLQAMGSPPEAVESALRLSLGAFTTAAEIDVAVERIVRVVRRLRGRESTYSKR